MFEYFKEIRELKQRMGKTISIILSAAMLMSALPADLLGGFASVKAAEAGTGLVLTASELSGEVSQSGSLKDTIFHAELKNGAKMALKEEPQSVGGVHFTKSLSMTPDTDIVFDAERKGTLTVYAAKGSHTGEDENTHNGGDESTHNGGDKGTHNGGDVSGTHNANDSRAAAFATSVFGAVNSGLQLKKNGSVVSETEVAEADKYEFAISGKDEYTLSVYGDEISLYRIEVVYEADSTHPGNEPTHGGDDGTHPGNEPTHGGDDSTHPGNDGHTDDMYIKFNDGDEYIYTGKAITPSITVFHNGEPLRAGVDYTVKYKNNTKATVSMNEGGDGYSVINSKKNATVIVTGKGNISGSAEGTFYILPKSLSDDDWQNAVNADEVEPMRTGDDGTLYVKKNAKAAPILLYGTMKLGSKDFSVENPSKKYQESGEEVTISAKLNGNYTGSVTLTVEVEEKFEKLTVKTEGKLTYNGTVQKPTVTVQGPKKAAVSEEYYTIVWPEDEKAMTDAGTVKFTVLGRGKYYGAITKSYKIAPFKNATINVTDEGKSYPYKSGGVTIDEDVTVKCAALGEESDVTLTLGKDYKITYSGNKKAGTAKYNVTLLGNYKGAKADKKNITFTIDKASFEELESAGSVKIVVPDKAYKKKGTYKSTPIVTVDNVTVKASEYTVTYLDAEGDPMPGNKPMIELRADEDFREVNVKLTAKDKSNYTGELTGSYIVGKTGNDIVDLSKAKVAFYERKADGTRGEKLTKFVYDGKVKEPIVEVTVGTTKYYSDEDLDKISVVYMNNQYKGKATVVVNGAGVETGVVGSKNASFSIVAKNLKKNNSDIAWSNKVEATGTSFIEALEELTR